MEINFPESTRIFLALPVDKIYHSAIARLQSGLMDDLEHLPHAIRWTKPHRLHLTLFFLGRHPAQSIDRLIYEMNKMDLSRLPKIDFSCNQIQLFPHIKPTVVALTGAPSSSLILLRKTVAECLKKARIHPDLTYENYGFLPHVTLGKLEDASDLKNEPIDINFNFNQLILFKSVPIEPPRSPYVTHTSLYTCSLD